MAGVIGDDHKGRARRKVLAATDAEPVVAAQVDPHQDAPGCLRAGTDKTGLALEAAKAFAWLEAEVAGRAVLPVVH